MQGDHLWKLGRDDCDSTKSFSPRKPKPDRGNLTCMEVSKAWKPSNNFLSVQERLDPLLKLMMQPNNLKLLQKRDTKYLTQHKGSGIASTTLLAEKAQLAQENSVFAQENHFGASKGRLLNTTC
ncbi:hypothetical protein RHMOL_Rhmol13G0069900 [Rhododendron molle]|uniref:Uncharacterized protein n=1 Tax=Rhododendron molle TaxID=49168 RepID=A0ACC0L4T1_RHOML|nr:hypothetical protein RHMOL_Rhmol13G0069900 [Rhododendron molle]